MTTKRITTVLPGAVPPARPWRRVTVGVLSVAACALMSLGVTAAAGGSGSGDHLGLSGLAGAANASASLGSSTDCAGGGGVHEA